ncbi:PDR/VanB family oxidoreductase [Paraburkholderia sediminicola]|uniref:PDR/VanB family oxidoreductase n=1 Tax=Paraburkholderia sediminicola TaxID=458836 RepID=UPI0038B8B2D7
MSGPFQKAHVLSAADVAEGVKEIHLRPEGGVVGFDPGSHIDVTVDVGSGSSSRSYSLIGTPGRDGYVIAVRLDSGGRGGSRFMHGLHPGQAIGISGPKNNFHLSYASNEYLLLGGGIGITPLVGMAQVLLEKKKKFKLVYAGRSLGSMPFVEQLRDALGQRLVVHDDTADGRLNLGDLFKGLTNGSEAYVCGPVTMLEHARRVWTEGGRELHHLRFETFAASGSKPMQAFSVEVPRLNKSFVVRHDQTLLEALEQAGAEPLYNCRKGECGLCAVKVLGHSAEIDHRDVFFSDRERKKGEFLCSCVSRLAGGALTLDLP